MEKSDEEENTVLCYDIETDKSTSTERIRTTDRHFEFPSALPTELIEILRLATASRSTLYQHCYIHPPQVKLRPGAVGHGQLNCYGS